MSVGRQTSHWILVIFFAKDYMSETVFSSVFSNASYYPLPNYNWRGTSWFLLSLSFCLLSYKLCCKISKFILHIHTQKNELLRARLLLNVQSSCHNRVELLLLPLLISIMGVFILQNEGEMETPSHHKQSTPGYHKCLGKSHRKSGRRDPVVLPHVAAAS